MFVKARDVILADFLLILLNLTAQTHSILRNNLIIFSSASNERPEARSTIR